VPGEDIDRLTKSCDDVSLPPPIGNQLHADLPRSLGTSPELGLGKLASEAILQHLATRQKRQEILSSVGVDSVVAHGVVLDRQLQRVCRGLGLVRLGRAVLHTDEVGDGDGRQNADDHDDDHELDQSETSALLRHVLFLLWNEA